MGIDSELTSILREVVQFLECLREVKLSATLESIRDNLLLRSKETLTLFAVERIDRSGSPEAYLNMNASGRSGLLAVLKADSELQEYVGAEEQWPQKQQQDYYETFQAVELIRGNTIESSDRDGSNEEEIENALIEIYMNLAATQTKGTCQKCGPLSRKEGKKLFVFEQYRDCWVGLIGHHLLIYNSDRDTRPHTILPIRGYMARPAPNAVPRDQRKSEATFEIFCPGNRTFQFVARTSQDMEQWVTKICELNGSKIESKKQPKIIHRETKESTCAKGAQTTASEPISKKDQYQDVGLLVTDKSAPEDATVVVSVNNSEEVASSLKEPTPDTVNPSPPPLPARIPRRLPSVPVRGPTSYECPDEEEDDIYHRIEELRGPAHCYGNIGKALETRPVDNGPELETYDDVCTNAKEDSRTEQKAKNKNQNPVRGKVVDLINETTYDDASSATATKDVGNEENIVSYDDVKNLLPNTKIIKTRETEKIEEAEVQEEPVKSPQKKSFLNRVMSRKESPKKTEKKMKRKTLTPPPSTVQEPTTYDDVSGLANTQETKQIIEDEETEYTFPPPPRPIYAKPPPIVEAVNQEELYDDVSSCREKYKEEETCKVDQQAPTNSQRTPKKSNFVSSPGRGDNADNFVLCENTDYSQQAFEDNEHYQTPRADPAKYLPTDQQEELYDDIAILADFTARQKEVLGRKDSDDTKTQTGWEKRSKSRFVNGRKSKVIDSTSSETNSRRSSEIEDADDPDQQHGLIRMNTFQKLISKMENSLGKASVKKTPSMMLSKTNVTNNV
ncbi:uncharacterized protein LOC143188524 [Calliopsis andreniformis]|uniref:uncharacterized protein LOC143188524 n=1 Tax=Calliopsis andreniformis TaxID=337506 RepID=UPI003FCC3655